MKALRWVAVPLASTLAWYVSLFAGLTAASSLDYLCPAEFMISGLCTAWWHTYAVDTIIALFAAVAAFLIVLGATLAAPSRKLKVAWTAYIVGCAFAVYATSQTSAFAVLIAAVLSGLLAVFCVARFLGTSMLPNKSFKGDVAKATHP